MVLTSSNAFFTDVPTGSPLFLSILGAHLSGPLLLPTLYSHDLGAAIFLRMFSDVYARLNSPQEIVDSLPLNRLYYSFRFKAFPIEKYKATL